MTFWSAIGRQLRHPSGVAGWAIGHAMSLTNAQVNALAIAALDLDEASQVLELGCGPGCAVRTMAARARRGVVHAIDQSAAMLAQARARNRRAIRSGHVRLYCGTFEALPLPDCSIDRVLAVNVAYFWRNPEIVLREIHRVLRPGGKVTIYVTDRATMSHWKFAEAATHRLFDHDELLSLFGLGVLPWGPVGIAGVLLPWKIAGLVAVASRLTGPKG